MGDSKKQIVLEFQQLQEHLQSLTADRDLLKMEFERLANSSHRLLQQIKEDSSHASERKLHNFEAEKRRLEERLEALEHDIKEKDRKIALLDAKAGDYLKQVNQPSNSQFEDQKSSDDIVCSDVTCAVSVGEVKEVGYSAGVGGKEKIKCSDDNLRELVNVASMEEVKKKIEVDIKSNVSPGEELSCEKVTDDTKVSEKLGEQSKDIASRTGNGEISNDEESDEENIEKNEMIRALVDEAMKELKEEDMKASLAKNENGSAIDGSKEDVEEKKSCDGNGEQELVPDLKIQVIVKERNSSFQEGPIGGKYVDHEGKILGDTMQSVFTDCKQELKETTSQLHGVLSSLPRDTPKERPDDSISSKQTNGNGSPVRDQISSLSVLVSELRRVKDDMGKCMSVKEQSFIELEDQLQAANKEVNNLKASMSLLSKDLEEKNQSYQYLEEENKKKKMDIELKMSEIQEVTNKCSMLTEEKADILRKMEVLEIMMTEYRTEIEMLIAEKAKMEEKTKELISAKVATSTAEAEIDSRTSLEEKEKEIEELTGKIQDMEKQMKELNDKLKVTNKHLKVMAREREHKQKECEALRRKVETVELKMCELQGTFDMLVKAVMVERDDLIKDLEEKTGEIDELHRTLGQLKETHEQELDKVMIEKKSIDEELRKFKSGDLRPDGTKFVDKEELNAVIREKEKLEIEVRHRTKQIQSLESKVKTIQIEMDDFVGSLKEEMARLKEESAKSKEEKKNLEDVFASLQSEHKILQEKNKETQKILTQLEAANREKAENFEAQKQQLHDLQQQLEDLNTKNFNLNTDIYNKEKEFRDELTARERTIQELNLTLTNNQKQSMENYVALQEEMSTLETKLKTSLEESNRQAKDLEEKLKVSQEEKKMEVLELQAKLRTLMDEIREAKSDSLSLSQDAEVPSSSLAFVPSLPLDSSDSTSVFHSVVTETDHRAIDYHVKQQLEALRKRVKDLEEELEGMRRDLEVKEDEIKNHKEADVPRLQGKIKELTTEVETLRGKPSEGETFKDHAEFEAVIAAKEERIQQLDSKVSDLEKCLANKSGYISQLEGRLDSSPEVKNDVESHLEQINKLSTDISKLKDELEKTNEECKTLKSTVDQLEVDKRRFEEEKTKIIAEYEAKLHEANEKIKEINAELEQKKNLAERLELELSSSESSHVDEVARLESNHVGRIADVVKLHKRKIEQLKKHNAEKVSDLHDHIDELYKEKKSLEERLNIIKLDLDEKFSKSERDLIKEKQDLFSRIENLEKKVNCLEKEKLQIEKEKAELKQRFEDEQEEASNMQTQMVTDLEKLILNLESEKRQMEKEVYQLKSSGDLNVGLLEDSEKKIALLEDEIVITNKEKEILMDEIKKLKEIIGEETISRIREENEKSKILEEMAEKVKKLQSKLEESQISIEEQEQIYAHKLMEEKSDHMMQLKALRTELSEEVNEIDLRKEQVSLEYEDKIALIITEYEDRLTSTREQFEARILEEKAEFGRVLVSKIDEYEGKLGSQVEDLKAFESQIEVLQNELDEKMNIIEELEHNLDEVTLMKAALRAQVDDLKHTITKMTENGEDSYVDVLHSKYETRLAEVQEHYEGQLSYLRSFISTADIDVQRAGCSSPSQGSEYSIELSCLRPYLQGQSTPIAEFMAELKSQSMLGSDNEVHTSNHSFHLMRSASIAKNKEDTRSQSSADGKVGLSFNGLSAHLMAKSLSKTNNKCHSNGSIAQILSKSLSRSEQLRLSALDGKVEPQTMGSKSHMLSVSATGLEDLKQSNAGVTCESKPDSCTSDQPTSKANHDLRDTNLNPDSSGVSPTGAKPRPPRRGTSKPKSSPAAVPTSTVSVDESFTAATATSSTNLPSDSDPSNTTLDKYRIKVEMSACCVVQ